MSYHKTKIESLGVAISDKAMIEASGNYLAEFMPDNFRTLSTEQIDEFLESNACEAYEGICGKELFFMIADDARHIQNSWKV